MTFEKFSLFVSPFYQSARAHLASHAHEHLKSQLASNFPLQMSIKLTSEKFSSFVSPCYQNARTHLIMYRKEYPYIVKSMHMYICTIKLTFERYSSFVSPFCLIRAPALTSHTHEPVHYIAQRHWLFVNSCNCYDAVECLCECWGGGRRCGGC